MKKSRLLWLMSCFSILMMAVPPQFIASAIADGSCYECPEPTSYGPLTGVGDGICGACGDQTKTRTVYPCEFNNNPSYSCTNTPKQNRSTYQYSCHGPDEEGMIACYIGGMICEIGSAALCIAECATLAGCIACFLESIILGEVCECLMDECLCPCGYDGFQRGYGDGCS